MTALGHPNPGCGPECFGCKVASVAVEGSRATPSRFGANGVGPRTPDPAWERGVAGERRPGGGFMPYLDRTPGGTLEPVGVKHMANRRGQYENRLRELRESPRPFASSTKETA